MPETNEAAVLTVSEEIAFFAGWEAHKRGGAHVEDGREAARYAFATGFDFGDEGIGENLVRYPPEAASRLSVEPGPATENMGVRRWDEAAQEYVYDYSQTPAPASNSAVDGAIERLSHCVSNTKAHWSFATDTSPAVDVLVEDLRSLIAENAALRAERDEALRECTRWAQEAGEAKGKLEMSEAAGIVEGWKERALASEAREAALRERVEVLAEALKAADLLLGVMVASPFWKDTIDPVRELVEDTARTVRAALPAAAPDQQKGGDA